MGFVVHVSCLIHKESIAKFAHYEFYFLMLHIWKQ